MDIVGLSSVTPFMDARGEAPTKIRWIWMMISGYDIDALIEREREKKKTKAKCVWWLFVIRMGIMSSNLSGGSLGFPKIDFRIVTNHMDKAPAPVEMFKSLLNAIWKPYRLVQDLFLCCDAIFQHFGCNTYQQLTRCTDRGQNLHKAPPGLCRLELCSRFMQQAFFVASSNVGQEMQMFVKAATMASQNLIQKAVEFQLCWALM